jgi:undecaprenol kinase
VIDPNRLKRSFAHALRGVVVVFRHEQSFRLQVIAAATVIFLAILFSVSSSEFIVLLLLIGSILALEMINSIFERIVDSFKPRIHPIVKDIKDIMAGTVLLVSLIAIVIGVAIFDSYVVELVLGR